MFETSADYQAGLAAAIRSGQADSRFDQRRLAIYIRLIRNNIYGFIDRCYVETPKHLSAVNWAELKEDFVQNAQAQSPFFQDIAGEFAVFCCPHISDGIAALMDFEHTQLLAETAQMPSEKAHNPTAQMTLSPAAFVRRYNYAVTEDLTQRETAVLVWRDSEDDVSFQELDPFDSLLLQTLAETPLSLSELQTMLAEWMPPETEWRTALQQRWNEWLDNKVLTPK